MVFDRTKIAIDIPKYTIDKIVSLYEGTFSISGYNAGTFTPGTGSTTITHNLNRKCLSEMLWSTDGINFYDGGTENFTFTGVIQTCDTNTATIYGYNTQITSTVNITYKLYLIWPN